MFCASRFAFGTMIVSQLRVSTTVWRQRMATTLPCVPSASWTQSPTWIVPSSCRATPPRMLPSVVCKLSARTPLTTADVVTTEDARDALRLQHAEDRDEIREPDDDVARDRDEGDADRGKQQVEDDEARELDARERGEEVGDDLGGLRPHRRRAQTREVWEDLRGARDEHEEDVKDQRPADARPLGGREPVDERSDQYERSADRREAPALEQLAQPAKASSRRIFCSRSCAALLPVAGLALSGRDTRDSG